MIYKEIERCIELLKILYNFYDNSLFSTDYKDLMRISQEHSVALFYDKDDVSSDGRIGIGSTSTGVIIKLETQPLTEDLMYQYTTNELGMLLTSNDNKQLILDGDWPERVIISTEQLNIPYEQLEFLYNSKVIDFIKIYNEHKGIKQKIPSDMSLFFLVVQSQTYVKFYSDINDKLDKLIEDFTGNN